MPRFLYAMKGIVMNEQEKQQHKCYKCIWGVDVGTHFFCPWQECKKEKRTMETQESKFINHIHKCELVMIYGKYLYRHCPLKYKTDTHDGSKCDECIHLRIVEMNDEGTHITGIL